MTFKAYITLKSEQFYYMIDAVDIEEAEDIALEDYPDAMYLSIEEDK